MKYIKTFEQFITESKINVATELDPEIEQLVKTLSQQPGCDQVDLGYIEMEMPFEVWPDSRNESYKNKLGLVFFPELITYGDSKGKVQRVPWIACRLELSSDSAAWVNGQEDQDVTSELLNRVIETLKGAGYTPFMDEDAFWNHWKRTTRGGDSNSYKYVEYTCYVNPSYPEGWWENHVIEKASSSLSIDELKDKYPNAIITMEPSDKFKDAYYAKLEIIRQDGEHEYIGALKGPVSKQNAIEFFNSTLNKNYDKYY